MMRNGHVQTIYPFLFRKVSSDIFDAERIELDDGDFIDIDFYKQSSDDLIIVSHGLEGASDKAYTRGISHHLASNHKQDVIAWNMRSCSGELNRLKTFYHGAQTEDITAVIKYALEHHAYKRIHLIGFSLGGNLTAYYATKIGKKEFPQVFSAVAVSAPIDLQSSVMKLGQTNFGKFYSGTFLATMKKKTIQKHKLGLIDISPRDINNCKTFIDFDNLITAPHFNFKSASEYYNFASARQHLEDTEIPILLIQSKDDPFLSRSCYPVRIAKKNPLVHLEMTISGGHVGFIQHEKTFDYWAEERAAQFINEQINAS
jgi:predicted alpha/beta-fold hydrolase